MLDRELRSLTIAERYTLSRWFALRYANCTKTEARNKAKATEIAASFATMARSKNYADLRVRQFRTYADKIHEQREGRPWFDAWLIEGVVRFRQC